MISVGKLNYLYFNKKANEINWKFWKNDLLILMPFVSDPTFSPWFRIC